MERYQQYETRKKKIEEKDKQTFRMKNIMIESKKTFVR